MGRRQAREIALHMVFELSFKEFLNYELTEERLNEEYMKSLGEEIEIYLADYSQVNKQYIKDVVKGVSLNIREIDVIISEYSKNWDIKRISKMSMAILRTAIYEIKYCENVPDGAIINEAVEFAKKYESEEAGAFINGILGSVVRGDDKA